MVRQNLFVLRAEVLTCAGIVFMLYFVLPAIAGAREMK
jgi:hypothetical protein